MTESNKNDDNGNNVKLEKRKGVVDVPKSKDKEKGRPQPTSSDGSD